MNQRAFRPLSGGFYETTLEMPLVPLGVVAPVAGQGGEQLQWGVKRFPVDESWLPVGWPYLRHAAVALAPRAAAEGFDVLTLSGLWLGGSAPGWVSSITVDCTLYQESSD